MFPETSPTISIIIPTRNSQRTIPECLESLIDLNYPRDKIEVILIDDSTDETIKTASKYPVKTIWFEGTPSAKRNLGVKIAKGELIGFVDSDCIVSPSWLQKVLPYFEDTKVAIVGGPNLTPENDTFLAKCSGYILSSFLGSAHMTSRYKVSGTTPHEAREEELVLCNMIVRKSAFEDVNGFDEDFYPAEEWRFYYDLQKKGYTIIYSPDVVVWHHRRSLFVPHLKQIFSYGLTRGKLIRKVFAAFRPTLLLPPLFFISMIATLILSLIELRFLYVFLGLLLMYFITAVASSLSIALRKKSLRVAAVLPIAYFLHHCAYGCGFVCGLLKD